MVLGARPGGDLARGASAGSSHTMSSLRYVRTDVLQKGSHAFYFLRQIKCLIFNEMFPTYLYTQIWSQKCL